MDHESLLSLLRDPAHVEFELLLTLVQDVLIGVLIWPAIKRRFTREHQRIDAEHGFSHEERVVRTSHDDGQIHD